MKKRLLIVTVLLACALVAARTTAFAATPAATPDETALLAKAKEWYFRIKTGNVDKSQLTEQLQKELTPALLKQEAAALKDFGTPTSIDLLQTDSIMGDASYTFGLGFDNGRVVESMAFDDTGKITAISIQIFQKVKK